MRVPTHQPCAAQWLRSMLTLPIVVASISCVRGELKTAHYYTEPTARPLTTQDMNDAPKPSQKLQDGLDADRKQRDDAVTALQNVKDGDKVQFPGEEPDDERAFPTPNPQGNSITYGPPVQGAAAYDLNTSNDLPTFQAGHVVAGLYLASSAAGMPAYGSLNLGARGVYCVHLKYQGPDISRWIAYIVPASNAPASNAACPAPGSSTPPLAVQYVANTDHPGKDDYPATMRFGVADDGSPYLIVRCGNAECYIGPRSVVGSLQPPPDYHDPNGALHGQREKAVRLWHDEQNLALTHSDGTLYPAVRATIVPLANIEKKTKTANFDGNFVPMAWITVPFLPDPASKYGTGANMHGMRLRPGNNLLWIGHDKTTDTWYAQIEPYGDDFQPLSASPVRYPVAIRYTDHANKKYVGAARFAWMATDDGLWVPCDQGCCIVSADAFAPPP